MATELPNIYRKIKLNTLQRCSAPQLSRVTVRCTLTKSLINATNIKVLCTNLTTLLFTRY